jgi:hypothetical protein
LLAVSLILLLVDVYYPRPVRGPYFSADGSGLLIPPLVNGFHDSSGAGMHSGSLGGSLNIPLVNGFHDSLRAVLLSGSLGRSLSLPLVVLYGEWDYSSFVGSPISYACR